jgi:F0F1-type ATP synthase membrane subunit b/b'
MDNLLSSLPLGVAIIAISFVVLLVGVVLTYFWLVKRYLHLQEDQSKAKLQSLDESRKLMEQAQGQANQVINDARVKAQEIISQAGIIQGTQAQALKESLDKAAQIELSEYQKILQNSSGEANKMLLKISEDIKGGVMTEIRSFQGQLQQEVVKSQEEVRKTLADSFINVKAEIDSYRDKRYQQIDNSIIEIIEDVTKRVIGKQIDLQEHEKLVMKVLEEAKRQHVF